jgi:hypothetical protein
VSRRAPALTSLLIAALLLLTGCVGIPTSGSVQTALIDTEPDEVSQVALPESPQPGQSMEDILLGFIRAGRGPLNSYQVAKEYLTAGARTDWNGTDRVLISSSSIVPVQVDDDTLTITLNVAAEVDASGRYVTSASTQTLSYDFEIVDGEFRIASSAPGTILSPNGFSVAFEEYPLYFFDPSFSYLVPDLRWFPDTRAAAQRIVTELLGDPAPWLGPSVLFSAFPSGTQGEATYVAPRVDVDLSSEVRAESPQTQLRMRQQLEYSLRTLPNVTDITVTSDGLTLASLANGQQPEYRYSVQDLVGGAAGAFGKLTPGGKVTALSGIEARANQLQPQAAALSRDRFSVAVLGPGGVALVGPSGDPIPVDGRPSLIAPTMDQYGYVWSVPAGDAGGLQATGADGVVHAIRLAADGQVVSIELARDGARLLVALETSAGPRLFIAGVVRDADLIPAALGTPYELPVDGTIVDVAWVDEVRVAVLRISEGGTTVDVLPLGGPIERLGPVDDGIAIVGGNGAEGLRVLAATGEVLRPSGAGGWVDTGLTASFLGTQQ